MPRLARAWAWLKRFGGWVVAAVLAVFSLSLHARRRPAGLSPSDVDALDTVDDANRRAVDDKVQRVLKSADESRSQAQAMGVEIAAAEAEVNFASDDELLDRLRKRYRNRRSGGGTALVVLLACAAGAARAQPFPMPHPETGEPGYWLATPEVREGERCLTVEPKLRLQLQLLGGALLEQDSAIAALQLQVASDARATRALRLSLREHTARAARAEAKLQSRWRHPWLWGGVGLALGTVVGGLAFTLAGG